jgi:hypothetical protein
MDVGHAAIAIAASRAIVYGLDRRRAAAQRNPPSAPTPPVA